MASGVLWKGKPLEDYTKEELIQIVIQMERSRAAAVEQHRKDLDLLGGFSQ